jgi:hypothetical protein
MGINGKGHHIRFLGLVVCAWVRLLISTLKAETDQKRAGWVISGFHYSANEIFTLLECYTAQIGT